MTAISAISPGLPLLLGALLLPAAGARLRAILVLGLPVLALLLYGRFLMAWHCASRSWNMS